MQRHSVTARWAKVAADADAFLVPLERRAVTPRVVVTERNPLMRIIANRLHALPARCHMAEQRPGQIGQLLGVAIAAAEQIDQHIVRQFSDIELPRIGRHIVGQTAI